MPRELRIIGPPGTGKTTTLATRCRQAARRYGGKNVMVCSLTKAAAAEVAGRDTQLPPENIATLHALAYRGIGKPQVAQNPKYLRAWNDRVRNVHPYYVLTLSSVELDDALDDAPVEDDRERQTDGDRLFADMQVCRARLTAFEEWPLALQQFAEEWNCFKQDLDLVDFPDMLELAWRDCQTAPGDPDVLLVDEAQDVPMLGMRLLRKWARQVEFFGVVGDPLQNQYEWAGSDWRSFVTPDIRDEDKEILSQSFRVPAAIHSAALRWIAQQKANVETQFGKAFDYAPRRDATGVVVPGNVGILNDVTWKWPEAALPCVDEWLGAGRTVMFLATCGYMLEPLLAVLRREGYPFHNPSRVKRRDWNPLAGSDRTLPKHRLLDFLRLSSDAWPGTCRDSWTLTELWNWIELLGAQRWNEQTSVLLRRAKVSIERALHANEDRPELELALDDLLQWFVPEELLVAMDESAAGRVDWLEQHADGTRRRSLDYLMQVCRRCGARALKERPQIIVGTIHSLKGAEADVTVLFPDLSRSGFDEWDRVPSAGRDGIERTFYVGITRAREELFLCAPTSRRSVFDELLQAIRPFD